MQQNSHKYQIGELCILTKGEYATLKTEPGEYPLVVTAAFRRSSNTYQLEGPAVCVPLISSTGHGHAALHRVHYQEGKFALANLLVALQPNDPNICYPKYLYYLLTTKKDELFVPLMQGTANVSLKEDDIAGVEIVLPSLTEQQRIVARIEELSTKIEEARSIRKLSTDEADSLMASEEMRLWPNESLREAPTLEGVTTHLARGRQSTQGHSDHYLIKTQHVQMGRYVQTKMTLSPHVANKVHTESLVSPGDVLIACSAAGCLGRVAFYGDGGGRIISTDTHVAIARPNRDRVLPEYLYAYLRGAQGQIQLRSREKGDWTREKIGFRLTELNVADMRRIPIPLASTSEQRRIVAYLDDLQAKVDAVKKLQKETSEELNALMPSILSRAFSGEL